MGDFNGNPTTRALIPEGAGAGGFNAFTQQGIREAAAEKQAEAQGESDVKQYAGLHSGLAGAGMTASNQLPYPRPREAFSQIHNSIPASASRLIWRASAASPLLASIPVPLFRKRRSARANVLQQVNSLKAEQEAMGERGGRIFQQQIEMMEKAAQNPDNSIAANKFLTEIAWRGAQRSRTIADMADDYKLEHGALDELSTG